MTSSGTTTAQDARSIAEDISDRIKAGEITTRECLIEAVHETVDGCARVIYTHQAREAVCEHGAEAYTNRFGEAGLTRDGDINWPSIAFCIVEELVWEALESEFNVDPNNPFTCQTCGKTHEDLWEAQDCCDDSEEA